MTTKQVIQMAHNPARFAERDIRAALRHLQTLPKGELLQWCERKLTAHLDRYR